jgi:hypothetical protein
VEEPLERLRDEVARQDEHSHVDAAVRERIAEVVLEVENERLAETARRLVERLSAEELEQLVADWLDARTAIERSARRQALCAPVLRQSAPV